MLHHDLQDVVYCQHAAATTHLDVLAKRKLCGRDALLLRGPCLKENPVWGMATPCSTHPLARCGEVTESSVTTIQSHLPSVAGFWTIGQNPNNTGIHHEADLRSRKWQNSRTPRRASLRACTLGADAPLKFPMAWPYRCSNFAYNSPRPMPEDELCEMWARRPQKERVHAGVTTAARHAQRIPNFRVT